jgi:hypothetical protein
VDCLDDLSKILRQEDGNHANRQSPLIS